MSEPTIIGISWQVFKHGNWIYRLGKVLVTFWKWIGFWIINPELFVSLHGSIISNKKQNLELVFNGIKELERELREVKERTNALEFTFADTGLHFIIRVVPSYESHECKLMTVTRVDVREHRLKIFRSKALDDLRSDFYESMNIVRNNCQDKPMYREAIYLRFHKLLSYGSRKFCIEKMDVVVESKTLQISGLHGKDYRWAIKSAVAIVKST